MPALVIGRDGLADPGLIGAVAAGSPVAIEDGLLAAVQERCDQVGRPCATGSRCTG